MSTNELQDKSYETQNNAGELEQRASTLTNKARAFKETAQQWSRQATDSTRKAAKATGVYVSENPWIAIACVGISCLAIGFLLGRSRDQNRGVAD